MIPPSLFNQTRLLNVSSLRFIRDRSGVAYFSSSSFNLDSNIDSLKNKARAPHAHNNTPESIVSKIGRNLHRQPDHPLNIVKQRIEDYCQSYAMKKYKKIKTNENSCESDSNTIKFQIFDDMSPIVTKKRCFDDLLVKPDHVSRSPSDTYYLNDELLMRTHTSAHQTELISRGVNLFLCSGDCYRRDEIDSSHYPVFHQMEGVKIFHESELVPNDEERSNAIIEEDLKELLTGLAVHLFGKVEMKWSADYFPFTDPSFELEVNFRDQWLEVLGCGVIEPQVIFNAGREGSKGWAFGLGLERLAMILFQIPDIRLFWTDDKRFHNQFVGLSKDHQKLVTFVPYSKYPLCYKDVSFWLPSAGGNPSVSTYHSNDFYEVIRDVAGDLVEEVQLFDEFTNKKTGRTSHAYRINYRHMDRSLTNAEVDEIQFKLRHELVTRLGVELR